MLCRCKESAKQTLHPKINSLRKVVLRWCFASPVATKLRSNLCDPLRKGGLEKHPPRRGFADASPHQRLDLMGV